MRTFFLKNNMTWCEAYNCSNYSKNNPEKTLEKEKFNNRGHCAKYLVEYKEQKYWDQFYEITLFRAATETRFSDWCSTDSVKTTLKYV